MADQVEWIGLTEAARMLGVHPATVRGWADRGYIASQRTPGGHRRFRVADLVAWMESQRSGSAAEAQILVQSALGRARLEIGEGHLSSAPWYQHLNTEAREAMRTYGRRLLETLQQYLVHPGERALADGRQLGINYGQILQKSGLKLGEAVQGFLTFQDFVLDSVINLMEMSRSTEWPQAMRSVNTFTRAVILGLVETYSEK